MISFFLLRVSLPPLALEAKVRELSVELHKHRERQKLLDGVGRFGYGPR